MACKLVVIKQKRPSLNVPFFVASEAQKTASTTGIVGVTGQRNINNGLNNVRTIFFPSAERFAEWEANTGVKTLQTARAAYNTAHGITEHTIVIDLPNLSAY
jgi:hypothetical protein